MTSSEHKPHRERSINMLCDVSHAQGLAQALAKPITKDIRPGSMEEVAHEIVTLLDGVRQELLRGV